VLAQLELDLDDVRQRIPWEGRSPRGLTRVNMELFLSRGAQKAVRCDLGPGQLSLFPEAKKGSRIYSGAPLLLPLLEDDHG